MEQRLRRGDSSPFSKKEMTEGLGAWGEERGLGFIGDFCPEVKAVE